MIQFFLYHIYNFVILNLAHYLIDNQIDANPFYCNTVQISPHYCETQFCKNVTPCIQRGACNIRILIFDSRNFEHLQWNQLFRCILMKGAVHKLWLIEWKVTCGSDVIKIQQLFRFVKYAALTQRSTTKNQPQRE